MHILYVDIYERFNLQIFVFIRRLRAVKILYTGKMGTLMMMVLLGTVGALAAKEHCESGQYTSSGECCLECPPGEGVQQPCGSKQTICTVCLDSETFSDKYSLSEPCRSCTECEGQMRMLTPCTDTNDAICGCNYGFYMNETTGRCEHCTSCLPGHGMLVQCDHHSDTLCEVCPEDTFSETESMLDPCLPCTICDDEPPLELCTTMRDTVCYEEPSIETFSPLPSVDSILPSFTDAPEDTDILSPTDTTTVGNPSSPRVVHHGLSENLIPIYCSILAAVVVGLVAFIVFKRHRWNSCKQNKQAASNRSVSQTASAEGEKLHSDSGISVDSQSLQEQQQQAQTPTQGLPHTVVMVDGSPGFALPPHKSEELEQLLGGGGGDGTDDETDWRSLASLLGYQEEHIAAFGQEERPVRALLSHWAGMDSASLEALCAALRKMDRGDIAQGLSLHPDADPSATSAV
ncbi:tumor necrosis factor receptor superfamily member 16 isoform X1 [Paramormyrops kingsleyae]|uniref:tumor necrosis factor receptor superfamily member 16 isoform X1 n=1 Tax=Paramormyrops kingsleyae TaxID=1676925 RepID=UPI003B9798C6